MKSLIINAFGIDRFGLVSEISEIIYRLNGNIEKSHMSKIDKEFSITMLATINTAITIKKISLQLNAIYDLEVHVKEVPPIKTTENPDKWIIRVEGADHEGIIFYISDILKKNGINIIELITNTTNAPITGSVLFNMKLIFEETNNKAIQIIKRKINEKSKKLNLDISIAKVS